MNNNNYVSKRELQAKRVLAGKEPQPNHIWCKDGRFQMIVIAVNEYSVVVQRHTRVTSSRGYTIDFEAPTEVMTLERFQDETTTLSVWVADTRNWLAACNVLKAATTLVLTKAEHDTLRQQELKAA